MEKVFKRIIFDLSIKLPNLEIKEPIVKIQDFLDINDKMAESLKGLFKISEHLNLFEKFADELIIKGEINGMMDDDIFHPGVDPDWFNIEAFVISLNNLPRIFNCKADWKGFFEEISPHAEYVYRSPEFICKETPYFFTREGKSNHGAIDYMMESMERRKKDYEVGNINEDGDWVNY
jgi:hypothetical protein